MKTFLGLNPCSCGGWSQSSAEPAAETASEEVLILVLVEDGLRDLRGIYRSSKITEVLILVLVEDGLRG